MTLALLGAGELQIIEAEGVAPRALGHVQAVQLAKDAALRQVVLSACRQLTQSDPAIARCAIAEDRLFAGFAGVVSKLEVISEEKTRTEVRVRVRAEVSLKAVSAEEVEAQRLYQRLSTLRLAVGLPGQLQDGGFTIVVKTTAPTKELASGLSKGMGNRLSVTGVRSTAIDAVAR